jgi:hypothetical protein
MNLILSRDHGFVHVIDLYMFPYAIPHTSTLPHPQDFYNDRSLSPLFQHVKSNSIFRLFNFKSPSFADLHQWNIGDTYEFAINNGHLGVEPMSYISIPAEEYDIYNITGVTAAAGSVTYSYTGTKLTFDGTWDPYSYHNVISYAPTTISGTLTYNSSLLIDTSLMPEELGQQSLYYYAPQDGGFCIDGAFYKITKSGLLRAYYLTPFEWSYPDWNYKIPLGFLSTDYFWSDGLMYHIFNNLIYYRRDGKGCGSQYPTNSVPIVYSQDDIKLFPNPCSYVLHINQLSVPANYRVINMVGTTVHAGALEAGDNSIAVHNLPAGIYSLVIEGINGERVVKKVVNE